MSHAHEWKVYNTAVGVPAIMVKCDCGATGTIKDFTMEEWQLAFYSPSRWFFWSEQSYDRVRESFE